MTATSLEQAKDLLKRLREAKKAFENTGFLIVRGERDAPEEYAESEVNGRYVGMWWMLSIAINDALEMVKQWKEEEGQ